MNSKSEKIFEDESLAYFKRGFDDQKYLEDRPPDDFTELFDSVINPKKFRVLDVGCGSGANLRFLLEKFGCECHGLEPNEDLVAKLNRDNVGSTKKINYYSGYSNKLDFEDDSFDLVICWSVLHWVHRNHILQSLGEILRVSKKFVVLMDFCPYTSYQTQYKFKTGMFTFKIDYSDIFEKTGIVKKISELIYFQPPKTKGNNQPYEVIGDDDYRTEKYDWVARKRSVFEKNPDLIPLKTINDFKII